MSNADRIANIQAEARITMTASPRVAYACAITVLAISSAVHAQTYPTKAVRIIIPFPPGGNTDIYARPISAKMGEIYGHQMIVDNRPGAGGSIGMQIAASQPPDGYTLVWGSTSTHGVGPNVYKKLPYDAVKDFEPVILTVVAQNILVVHPSVPAKNVKELIAIAKAKRGGLSYASSGNGTISHLAGELFRTMTGADIVHVPYKGSSPAMVDLLSGQIDLMFDSLSSSLPQAKAGKLRALAVTGNKRFPGMKDLPTINESGLKGYEVTTWLAIWAPAHTPPDIVNRLNADINKILQQPGILQLMADNGAEPGGGSPERLGNHVKSEIAKWGAVVKAANIKIE
jgi:tripartite-type tricarboxylate transporter receptor subunit TctC